MNSIFLGDYAELRAAAIFTKKGWVVSKPLTQNSTYDLIIDKNGVLKKVQVKSRQVRSNKICVELFTCMRNYKKIYKETDFDLLVVYSQDLDQLALFDWDNLRDVKVLTIRIKEPLNSQKVGVTLFQDYLME